jgi:hypothetical protein
MLPCICSCSCYWTEFRFYRLWSYLAIYSPVLLESKYVRKFTWLYLLNGRLLCYNCCINVKLIHYHLVSDFKTYSSFFNFLLPTGRLEIQTFYLTNQEESSRYMSNLLVSLHQELLIIRAEFSLWFSSMADWHSGHSVGPWRQLHRPAKWLSRHTKLSSIFTKLLPSTMSCVCFEHLVSHWLEQENSTRCQKWIHVFRTIHEKSTECLFN